jgi:hypothetical protein
MVCVFVKLYYQARNRYTDLISVGFYPWILGLIYILNKIYFYFLLILLVIIFLNFNYQISCSNILSEACLNTTKYYYYGKNHTCLAENINFLLNNQQNWKLYLLKYKPLDMLDTQVQRNSPWSHYHLWINSCNLPYKNLLVNFQLTHNPPNVYNYIYMSVEDLVNNTQSQFITNYLYS